MTSQLAQESIWRRIISVATLALAVATFCGGCGLTAPGDTAQADTQPIYVTVTPTAANVLLGNSLPLTAWVSNTTDTAVNWSVNGIPGGNNAIGTIIGGIFTAPQILPSPAIVELTATSEADPSKSASATVSITSDISMTVMPASAAVELGALQNFQAGIISAGKPATSVSWTLSGTGCTKSDCGSISPTGIFTAPGIIPSPPTVLLTATSVADPSKNASIPITLTSRFTLAINGPSAVTASSQASFAAVLTPAANSNPSQAILWSVAGSNCSGIGCGTITGQGPGANAVYTAPAAPAGPVTITATPLADPSKAQSMQVAINPGAAVTISPTAATVALGAATIFTATISGGTNTGIVWDVNGIAGGNAVLGTIAASQGNSGTATYTAPQNMPTTNPVVVRASNISAPNASASAQVTLYAPVQVSLSPASASLIVGTRQTLTAGVANSSNTNVTWQVNGISGGNSSVGQICVVNSIPCQTVTSSQAGSVDYLAPGAIPSPNPVTVAAVSQADGTRSASSITILPHVTVSVSPPSVTLAPGASQSFTANVSGSANQQVTWSLSGPACGGANALCGTIDADGVYLAPAAAPVPNTFNIVATSAADTARSGTASVTITAPPAIISLLPSSALAGATGGFSLKVEGANFSASSPGPGSTILISGTARSTACTSSSLCSTTLAVGDLQSAASLNVTVQNPGGSISNTAAFSVIALGGATENIPVTSGSPAVTGKDIVVADLSTDGSAAPAQDANMSVVAIGAYQPSSGACTLGGGPITLTRPATGSATEDLCAFSISGLDPSFHYALSGPVPGDITITGAEPLGLGIVHLILQVPSSAKTGARSLLIQNANQDMTAASGAIDVL